MLNSNYPAFPAELTGRWVCPGFCNTSWRLPFLCFKWICSPPGWPPQLHAVFLRHHNLLSLLNCWCKLGAACPHFNTEDEALVVQAAPEGSRDRRWLNYNCLGTYWGHCQIQWRQNILSIYFLKLQKNWYFPLYFKISCQKRRQKFLANKNCSG